MNLVATVPLRGWIHWLAVATAIPTGLALAEQPQMKMRPTVEVTTESALREKVAKTTSLKDHLASKAKPVVEKPPVAQSSLWTRSIILSDGEKFTLVPIGSILHLPESLRSHVLTKAQGDFTFWPNFLKRNADWLGAKEVTLTMAKGNEQAAKTLLRSISTDRRVLVAVYKGGPITVLEAASETTPAKKP